MPKITRNFYISLLAFVCILGSGAFLFQGSKGASQATVVVAFVVMFTLIHVLDDRDGDRRQSND